MTLLSNPSINALIDNINMICLNFNIAANDSTLFKNGETINIVCKINLANVSYGLIYPHPILRFIFRHEHTSVEHATRNSM